MPKAILYSVEIVVIVLLVMAFFAERRSVPRVSEREVNKWGAIEL